MTQPLLTLQKERTTVSHILSTPLAKVVDGQVVKCIRSTGCAYKLSVHSKLKQDAANARMFYGLSYVGGKHLHLAHWNPKLPMILILNSVSLPVLNSSPGQKIYTKWLPKVNSKEKPKNITVYIKKKNKET